ncbi:hypothetical protein GLAREA_06613 [Glarea lozoyensis ATCC 20868]|uniref:Uncharacterized protein n=2 Tax=Glarea lozoyensis TaxID=101852 RepID=S3D718_GLAL2|nr:uncharacterized protein GLAREA_06613 [Glarea lozoyensis ATCC 20868]EHK99446.1 hypothetical protein M7I_4745 [Glarea lozoyensis 74030]EPE33600.1 hypothetical protein GLAREA_06613 [Glarea lozoyensis ATCC 20868]
MVSSSKVIVQAVALVVLVQYCPAPFLAAIPAAVAAGIGAASAAVSAAAAVAGVVVDAVKNRDLEEVNAPRTFISRVKRAPQGFDISTIGFGTAFEDCKTQLNGASVTFSGPAPGTVLVVGIPPACMTLSGVLAGGDFNEGKPVPMGVDSLQFTDLSNESILEIQAALDAHPAKKN